MGLGSWPKQASEDSLNADLAGRKGQWLKLRIGRMKLHVDTAAEQTFESGLVLLDQKRHHDLSIARICAILYQSYIAITDVFVDH